MYINELKEKKHLIKLLAFIALGIILLFTVPDFQYALLTRNCRHIEAKDALYAVFHHGYISNGVWRLNDSICMSLGNTYYRYKGKDAFEVTQHGDTLLKLPLSENLVLKKKGGYIIHFEKYFAEQ